MEETIRKLIQGKRNYVFIGEAGSGKTETALSFARALARIESRKVHFFDMDQTKPVLRARDAGRILEEEGVVFHYQDQFLDAPTVASGVREILQNRSCTAILGIGGGTYGSHMIGQFAAYLNTPETETFYVVNPYRPWSGSKEDIAETMQRVLGAAGLRNYTVIANPNLGVRTTPEHIIRGIEEIKALFEDTDREICFVCAREDLRPEVERQITIPVFGIDISMLPPWLV